MLVTGAERGIGRDLAIGIAEAGADILINFYTSEEEAEKTSEMCRRTGGMVATEFGDVRHAGTGMQLIRRAVDAFGRIDGIVNNAGVHIYQALNAVTEGEWDRQLATNVKGPFFIAQSAAAYWRQNRIPGRIVNITSCGSIVPFPQSAAYNASKGALLMLTRQLALDLASDGIRVNAVAPGVIHTEINDALLRIPEHERAWSQAIPTGRTGKASDLLGTVVLLLSEAGAYITGQQFVIDGGWSIHPAWGVEPSGSA